MPILRTPRLILIPPREQDAHPSFDAIQASMQEIGPWFTWAHENLTLEQHRLYVQECTAAAQDIYTHDHLSFFVWDMNQDNLIGEIWYKIRDWAMPYIIISYWFDSRHTGQGYATEAISEIVKYAFNILKAKHVELDIAEQNINSIALAKRLGFTFEEKLEDRCKNYVTGEVMASEIYAMTDIAQLHLNIAKNR